MSAHQQRPPRQSGHLRWLNELLFSLNAALLIIPVASVRMRHPILMIIGRSLFNFAYIHWPFAVPWVVRDTDPSRKYFAALVPASAALLFLLFRITARLSLTRAFLRTAPGVVALAGLPVALRLLEPFPLALFIEVVAAALCALLYLYGKWKLPSPISIFLLVLHFGFWSWGALHWLGLWMTYPLLGFCSALIWGLYVRRVAEARPAVGVATAQ